MTITRTNSSKTHVHALEVRNIAEARQLDPSELQPEAPNEEVANVNKKSKKTPKQKPNKRSHKPRGGRVYHNATVPV